MRDVSLIERISLRDHEAMEEVLRVYGDAVRRIAASVLGPDYRHLASAVAEEVWRTLWNQAHRYDMDRADTTGWIHALARETALAHLRDKTGRIVDEPRMRIIGVELAESAADGFPPDAGAGSAAPDISQALRTLPPADRELLLRRYAYLEDLPDLSAATGIPREAIADRLRLARNRLHEIWSPAKAGDRSPTVRLEDWNQLDPGLFSETAPETPLSRSALEAEAADRLAEARAKSGSPVRRVSARAVWTVGVLLVVIGAFALGYHLFPSIRHTFPTQPVSTGPGASSTPSVPRESVEGKASLITLLDFQWEDISSVAIVRTADNGVRRSRTLRETDDLAHLRSLLTSMEYVHSSASGNQAGSIRSYELQINAAGFHTLLFYENEEGYVSVSGSFLTVVFGTGNDRILRSDDTLFSDFAQEMDTLMSLFG